MKTKAQVIDVQVTNRFRTLCLRFRGIGENGCSIYNMALSIPLGGFEYGRFSERFVVQIAKEADSFLNRSSRGEFELDKASLIAQLEAWAF